MWRIGTRHRWNDESDQRGDHENGRTSLTSH